MRKISYSQYSLWSTCPQAWKLKYADGIRLPDNSIDSIFGTACHEVIQSWLSRRYDGSNYETSLKTMTTHLKTRLRELFVQHIRVDETTQEKVYLCDQATLAQYYTEGVAILTELVQNEDRYFPTEHRTLYGIETELTIPLSDTEQFTGFIDIVLYDTEHDVYTIIDLKTAKSGWSHWQKTDDKKLHQILLYKKYFAQQFNVPLKHIQVEFIILTRQTVNTRLERFIPVHTPMAIKNATIKFEHFLKSALDANGQVRTTNLVPKPSKSACRFCAFRLHKDICAVSVYPLDE